ncbi:4-hydroxythreonine-4-phosphate dehydrogenase PdxA [Lactonifactor longoviformis]|uniref:Putative D-threonate 4-phosphate dehydrogenase n=1 Tax=Lactonifactor longoviformis DSM 17459 TaxID=1122155 RepID=A0A1M4UVS4_9CLOT|nr:4-hydroxythreonine-4-phosphate dehydrogenase PdxA [Lactonifactor longoviformis]POP33797.1 4-hydroxythreonine-4-phosphate dehydrogenase PdxA [Lactonifactor longoviformis]SHE60700.1 4-hydroxythreonine-4-phosphate dehydrogenase [Lactonifactor longoviformis DSM 17459]
MDRPILAITMGDPAGSGPEISVKALSNDKIYQKARPLIIGDARVMEKAVRLVGLERKLTIHEITDIKDARFTPGYIDVYHLELVDMEKLEYGKVSAMCGNAAFHSVKKAIRLAMDGEVDATVTNALNKEALNLAGHHYSGHTEIYARFTGAEKYTMLLAHENLRVVHVSTHVSLRDACDKVKKERVLDVIRIAEKACRALGIENPKVGVAGLNPHCGENGLFGTEEITEIQPAIKAAQDEGILAEGPIPPDTVFSKARGGMYDIVVAMYHDQGHIPLKVVGFVYDRDKREWNAVKGVNITLGLPIIRTSVDHGTAFGHAGKGNANAASLENAIDYAVTLAKNR